jgi:O-methyltransferase involved in polyketide biosynthesis
MTDLQQTKIKINLSGLPQTSLMPLYGRAKVSTDFGSLFNDAKAIELVRRIDYDFSTFDKVVVDYFWFVYAARAMQFDNEVKAYIKEHPNTSVINLGAGFDTAFFRVDNGKIRWYDLDLPEVIEVRKLLIPETDRSTCIAKSFLDPSWCQDIKTEDGVFLIAAGFFHYFDEATLRQFFSLLTDSFSSYQIVFEAESKSSIVVDGNYGAYGAGWSDEEPEKRNAIQEEALRGLKNLWVVTPLTLRNMMVKSLTTQNKPQSSEWDDFEIWWDQLNAQEKGKTMSDLVAGSYMTCRFPLEDAKEMTKWDDRITVFDQFPLFRNVLRDPSFSLSVRQFMDYTDEKGRIKIAHLRV